MHPGGTTAYLLLGSNLGNRERFLARAGEQIARQAGDIVAASSVYETEPWGVTGQPAYLNQVIKLHTLLLPEALLQCILAIEVGLGRIRQQEWASRTIDIDILYYDSLVLRSPALEIPHPRLHVRNFVLYPLEEIAPEYIHPLLNKSNRELLQESADTSVVEKKPIATVSGDFPAH